MRNEFGSNTIRPKTQGASQAMLRGMDLADVDMRKTQVRFTGIFCWRFVSRVALFLAMVSLATLAHAAITISFDLAVDKADNTTPVPTNVQNEIMSAINAAVGVFNQWSNYSKNLYVIYRSDVATADGNFNGTIRFGPSAAYRTPNVAFHEINHTLGAGTYGTWASNVDNFAKLWLGANGIAMSQQYYPTNTLKADLHIHWVGGGVLQDIEMKREGVHILGAIRQDMGLSNDNLYDVLGDFSNNGSIGLEDYAMLVANAHTNISALSPSQAWLRGDFNVDSAIDYSDLVGFTNAYDAVHGLGALQRALAIPEPTAAALLVLGSMGLAMRFRTQRRRLARGAFVLVLACAFVVTSCDESYAQLRYVDASTTGGSPNTGPTSAFLPGMNNQADDNLWSLRTGFSSGGTFFQSGDGNGENSPEILSTISGLTPNAFYQIYTHFWDGSGPSPDWNIRAGFASNPGANTLFANPGDAADIGATPAVLASTLSYALPPTVFVEADRTMYAGLVGTTKANVAGQITVYLDDLPSTIGVNQRTWYDGLSYQLTTLATLSLRVNTVTGAVSIRNETAAAQDIRYYEIRSASGVFNPIRWSSLDEQEGSDPVGVGWDELGGSSANILSEYNFQSTMTFAAADAAYLGRVFNVGGMTDVIFNYGLAGQTTLTAGFVDYVATPGLPGDFNGDSAVDGLDLSQWQGDYSTNAFSDANGDGDSDGADFLVWQRHFGAAESVVAHLIVPETPSAVLVLALALTINVRHTYSRV